MKKKSEGGRGVSGARERCPKLERELMCVELFGCVMGVFSRRLGWAPSTQGERGLKWLAWRVFNVGVAPPVAILYCFGCRTSFLCE